MSSGLTLPGGIIGLVIAGAIGDSIRWVSEKLGAYWAPRSAKIVAKKMLYMDLEAGKRSKVGTCPLAKDLIKTLIKELTTGISLTLAKVFKKELGNSLHETISGTLKEDLVAKIAKNIASSVGDTVSKNVGITIPTVMNRYVVDGKGHQSRFVGRVSFVVCPLALFCICTFSIRYVFRFCLFLIFAEGCPSNI